MIRNVRHTGIVVHDLEKMAEFYRSLGFIDENRAVECGPFIEQVVDLAGVKIEWIKMRSPDGCMLELLQYHSHPQTVESDMAKANDLGCSHLALTVDDITSACEEIVRAGGSVGNLPATAPNGKVKVAYCHDPEGVLIEIVEELD
jgi:catechol 2,3-dioxygenase-like lactoylglutathione lyase family enzyme